MVPGDNTFTRFKSLIVNDPLVRPRRTYEHISYVGVVRGFQTEGFPTYKHRPNPILVESMSDDIPHLNDWLFMQPNLDDEYVNFNKYSNSPDPNALDVRLFALAVFMMMCQNQQIFGTCSPGDSFDGYEYNPKSSVTHMWKTHLERKGGPKIKKKDVILDPGPEIDYFYDNAHKENLFIASTVCGKSEMLKAVKIWLGECRIFINVDPCLEFYGKRLLSSFVDACKFKGPGSDYMVGFSKQHSGLEDVLSYCEAWINGRPYEVDESDVAKWDSRMSKLLFCVCKILAFFSMLVELQTLDMLGRVNFYYDNITDSFVIMHDGHVFRKWTGNNSGSYTTTHDNNIGVRTIEFYDLLKALPDVLNMLDLSPVLWVFSKLNTGEQLNMMHLFVIKDFWYKNKKIFDEIYRRICRSVLFVQYSDDLNRLRSGEFYGKAKLDEHAKSYSDFGCELDIGRSKVYRDIEQLTFLGFTVRRVLYSGKIIRVPRGNLQKAKHSLYYTPRQHRMDVMFQVAVSFMIETFFDLDTSGQSGYDYFLPIAEKFRPYKSDKVLIEVEKEWKQLLYDIPPKEAIFRIYASRE